MTHCMKATAKACAILAGSIVASHAQDSSNYWNHFTFSPRAAFNIGAKFMDIGTLSLSPTRKTPNGNTYNYDNGYVLTDVSGNAGGQTWYWGYDSSSQISGNSIQMSRSVAQSSGTVTAGQDFHDASFGADLSYSHRMGTIAGADFGVLAAASYLYVSLKDSSSLQGDVVQVTDSFSFASGTTPPAAPYQGTFNGPGYVIGATPSSTSSTVLPGAATITGQRQLQAHVIGLRLGPSVELPLEQNLGVVLSAGLATGLVHSGASWSETISVAGGPTVSGSGSGNKFDFLYGGYLSAGLSWHVNQRWNVEASAQYQNLGYARENLGGRTVELDLHRSLSVALGAGFSF